MPSYLPGKDKSADGGFGAGGGGASPFAPGARGFSGNGGRGAFPTSGVPSFAPGSAQNFRPPPSIPRNSTRFDPSDYLPSQLPSRGNINQRILDGLNSPRPRPRPANGDQSKINADIARKQIEKSQLDADIRRRAVDAARERYRRSRVDSERRLPRPIPTPAPSPVPSPSNGKTRIPSESPLPMGRGRGRLPRPVDRRNPDGSKWRPENLSREWKCFVLGQCEPGDRQDVPVERRDIPGGNIPGRVYFLTLYIQTLQLTSSGRKELFVAPSFLANVVGKLDNLRVVRFGANVQIRMTTQIGIAGSSGVDILLGGVVDFPPFVEFAGYWITLVPQTPIPGTSVPPFPGDEADYTRYPAAPFSPIPALIPSEPINPLPQTLPLPHGVPSPVQQPWFPPQPQTEPAPSPYPSPVSQPVPYSPARADSPDLYQEQAARTNPDFFTGLSPFPTPNGTPGNPPIPPVPCPPGCICACPNPQEPEMINFVPVTVIRFIGCSPVTGEAVFVNEIVPCIQGLESQIQLQFEAIANDAASICELRSKLIDIESSALRLEDVSVNVPECVSGDAALVPVSVKTIANGIGDSMALTWQRLFDNVSKLRIPNSRVCEIVSAPTLLFEGECTLSNPVWLSSAIPNDYSFYSLEILSFFENIRTYKLAQSPALSERGYGNFGILCSDASYSGGRVDVFVERTNIPTPAQAREVSFRVSIAPPSEFRVWGIK